MAQDIELQKRDYELSFLLKMPEAETEIADVLSQHQLEIFEKSPVSEIKLAYPIKKQSSAYFGFCYFRGQPEDAQKVSEFLLLKPSVLRYLLITPPVQSKTDAGRRAPRPSAPVKPAAAPAEIDIKPPRQEILSNELLEEKLEEILK